MSLEVDKVVSNTYTPSQGDNTMRFDPSLNGGVVSENQIYDFEGGDGVSQSASRGHSEDGEDNQYCVDAENFPGNENKLGLGFVPIRARVSDEADEDYEGDIEEEGSYASTGSYDSASERMATTFVTGIGSPEGSFLESSLLPGPATNAQKGALRKLNELNSGVPSLDTSLLENTDLEGFRDRVLEIAKAKSLSPDDDIVHSILIVLLPMVGKGAEDNILNGDEEMRVGGDLTRLIPVAKLTAEDDDGTDETDDLGRSPADMYDTTFDSGQLEEENIPDSARGLRVRGSDGESKGQEEDFIAPTSLSVRVPYSRLFSDQANTNLESETGFEGGTKLAGLSPQGSEETERRLQVKPMLEELEVDPNADEKVPSFFAGGNQERFDDVDVGDPGSSVANQEKDIKDLLANQESSSNEADDEGEPRKGGNDVGIDERLEIPAESPSSLPQVVSRDWETEGQREIAGLEVEQAGIRNSSSSFSNDRLNGDVSSQAQSFGVLASPIESSGTSPDLGPDGSIQRLGKVPEAESTTIKSVSKENGSMSAEEGNSVVELKDIVDAKRGDKGGGLEVELHGEEGESSTGDNSFPVGESVSSKPSADPASDTPSLGGAGPSLAVRPFGLGRSIPSLEHAPRAVQRNTTVSASSSSMEREDCGPNSDLSEGNQDAREKLQGIRIKFLCLAHRLGQPPHNPVVSQVLYRLGLAEQLRAGRGTGRPGVFSLERASVIAEEQEASGHDDLDFECTIMLLGKSGVGKSATVNSLFDEEKAGTNAYITATKKVQVVTGTVHGIRLRIIDTPGLLSSFADQRHNRRVMSSVKRFIKKSPPDIVLYFDRLDMQVRDYGDLPLLQIITETFGAAVWFNAIVALTHAASAPPDGANGLPMNYDMFVAQRSHVVQQTIRQAAGDMRLMNPVALIENHSACRTNRTGQKVLPNGNVWKSHLLLLCFASKILSEANSLLKLQDSNPVKPFAARSRGPPLPYLLSSLLQSRAPLRLPDEQGTDDDDESGNESEANEADSDGEEDYDDLPPFRRLTKEELKLLDKEQRKIYLEELEDREQLFMKKQLKEERKRRRERKRRMAALSKEATEVSVDQIEEENASAAVPVAMPDMALPPSFDSDNPTYRYRYLDSSNQWLVRPVLETHGWDHDSGYDGVNVEKMFIISQKIPASISGQATKDKKEANLQMECAASFENGEGTVTLTGLDIQTLGKELAYTIRGETRFNNFKRNKTTCGLTLTKLGDTVATGMKIEDRLMVGKRVKVLINGGALTGRGDVAYGGSLEASIRGKDYPIDRSSSSFGLSIMNWHGDLAIGGNLQVQLQLGKTLATTGRANLNNRGAGQISIRASSSEQVQMVLIGLIPLVRAFVNNRVLKANESGQ